MAALDSRLDVQKLLVKKAEGGRKIRELEAESAEISEELVQNGSRDARAIKIKSNIKAGLEVHVAASASSAASCAASCAVDVAT